MRTTALLLALLVPAVALADVAPGGGCRCDSGGTGGAVAVLVAAAALVRRR